METRAYIRNVKISPKKLRFLLSDIKGLTPDQALHHLHYTPLKGARIFYKAIKSAIQNAKDTLKVSEDSLRFKALTIEEGRKLKRFRAGGRGMAKPYVRRAAHIKVILEAKKEKKVKDQKSKVKNTSQK